MATISVHVDDALKQESETVFEAVGLNLDTAITVFLRLAVREGGFPFAQQHYPQDEAWRAYVDKALAEADEEAKNPGPRIGHEELMQRARSLVRELSAEI